jgi:hypothetical protein
VILSLNEKITSDKFFVVDAAKGQWISDSTHISPERAAVAAFVIVDDITRKAVSEDPLTFVAGAEQILKKFLDTK